MMGYYDEKIAKLPKWAQQYISKLEVDVEYHKNRSLAVASEEGTAICVEGGVVDKDRFLPDGVHIKFQLKNDSVSVKISDDKESLECRTERNRAAYLPVTSNVGMVRPVTY